MPFGLPGPPPAPTPQGPKPPQRVTAADGTVHVFPGEATPEMIAQALGTKPPAATTQVGTPPPPVGRETKIGPAPPSIFDSPLFPQPGMGLVAGAAKGAVKTVLGASQLVNRGLAAIGAADQVPPERFDAARMKYADASSSTAQQVGQTAEQIGEFMIPIGGEAKALAAGASKTARVIRGARTAATTGVDAAARTAVQTGGDPTATAAAGVTGAGMSAVLQPAAAAVRGNFGKATPAGEAANTYMRGAVTPAQVKDSQSLSLLENILQGSLFGGGRYRQFLQTQQTYFRDQAARIMEEGFGGAKHPEATGKAFQELRELARTTAKDAASKLYDDVDAIADGVQVSLKPLAEFIEADTAKRGKLAVAMRGGGQASVGRAITQSADDAAAAENPLAVIGSGSRAPMDPTHPAFGKSNHFDDFATMLADVGADSAEGLTFRQAHELRSALGAKIEMFERSTDANAANSLGFYKRLRSTLDKSMTDAAGGPSSPVRQAYDTATLAWRTMKENFEDNLLGEVAKVEPRRVAETLIQPKRIEEIDRAREAMGGVNSPAWKNVQNAHAQTLLMHGDDLATGEQMMTRLHKLSPETMQATYGPLADGFYQLARTMEQVQRKQPGIGKVAISLAQGGAAIGLVTLSATPAAGAVILGPAVLSRIMMAPVARRWLIQGVKEGGVMDRVTGPVAREAASKLAAWLVKEGLIAPPPRGQGGAGPAAPRDVTTGRASGAGPGPIGSAPPVGVPPGRSPVGQAGQPPVGVGQPPPPVRRDRE